MLKQVQLKSKNDLLKLGYENNSNPDDFLNLLTSKIVTLDLTKTIRTKNGIIYVSKEYPNYAIYDYLVKRVVPKTLTNQTSEYEYSLKEIAEYMQITFQRVDQIFKAAIKKLKINKNSKKLLYPYIME